MTSPGGTLFDPREVLALGRRHWRLLVVPAVVVAALVFLLTLLMEPRYSASVSLVPGSRSAATGQLAGLASLAGVSLGASTSETPAFYATVVTSRPMLHAVLTRRYPSVHGDSATLLNILQPGSGDPADRLWRASRKLLARSGVSTDIKTSIIRVTVDMQTAALAAAVANAFVDELNRFNRETRQTQAYARRVFTEARVEQASHDLTAAESAVRDFLERNHSFDRSPALQFEHTRLERAYTVQSELYLDLRRQLDAARIAEVDDVPTLTTIERAEVPTRASGPHRLRFALSAFVGTIALIGFWLISSRRREVWTPAARSSQP